MQFVSFAQSVVLWLAVCFRATSDLVAGNNMVLAVLHPNTFRAASFEMLTSLAM
tara:strand:+ start:377 stop:538 length:162 start_codon:yes stop_codon:yes gene_type:complete